MKVKKMILFLSVAMLLAGCDKDNAPVAVSEVTLSRTALTMTVGDTEKLTATVLPEHAGYDGLVWSSNNTSVALVDVEGLVTAVSAGNATITATVGGKQVTCEVTNIARRYLTLTLNVRRLILASLWLSSR